MKTKLTLSVDPRAVIRAKALARKRGISLSRMVEEHFSQLAPSESTRDHDRFFEKWQGAFATPNADNPESRLAGIAAKHLR